MEDVAQMLSVWSKTTGPRVYAHQTTWETHMSLVGDQSASQIQSVQQHLHAGMRSVWILVSVQGMPIARPEITGVSAPVSLDTLVTPMVLPVLKVSCNIFCWLKRDIFHNHYSIHLQFQS